MDPDVNLFGADFAWGVSAAAYQTEGAYNLDGKGLSIWDVFTRQRKKIRNQENGNTACDFYHRYRQDISLMRSLNIPNFRFSLAWSRLFPTGTGQPNKKGVDYYNQVIDFCLEHEIEPWVTLYHWDLPFELEVRGGWTNRDMVGWFGDYVSFCVKTFGDRVKNWIVLNEPMVFTGAGYFLGIHAPGRRGLGQFLPAVHHAALAQAEGIRIAKSASTGFHVGTSFSCSAIHPYSPALADCKAAKRIDALLNRLFVEPLLGLGYPVNDLPLLNRLDAYMKDGDEQRLRAVPDFIGLQNYTREVVAHSWFTPLVQATVVKAANRGVPLTQMGWEVYPEALYEMLTRFARYPVTEIVVTEGGAAFEDQLQNGKVVDPARRNFIRAQLQGVLKAKSEGVNVKGYFVWSFTDNFEWAEGYRPRFGLVYIDFETQKRIIKESGHWYGQFLGGRKVHRSTTISLSA